MMITSVFLKHYRNQHLLVLSQQWQHQNNVRDLFKSNNKDFAHCNCISIVHIEEVNTG